MCQVSVTDPTGHDGLVALNDLYAASNLFWVREHSTKPKARIAATEVLARLGGADPRIVQHLWRAVRDPDQEVRLATIATLDRLALRIACIRALAQLGDRSAVESLRRAVANVTNSGVRRVAGVDFVEPQGREAIPRRC